MRTLNRSLRRSPGSLIARVALSLALTVAFLPPMTQTAQASPTFVLSGHGWGHGVGMTQDGAQGYALQGKTFDWILGHYYSGTTLGAVPATSTVRVNLDKGKARRISWTLRSGYVGQRLTIDGRQTTPDHSFRFSKSVTGGLVVTDATTSTPFATYPAGTQVSVACSAPTGQPALIQVVDASGPFGYTQVRYRGSMLLDSATTGVRLDNHLNLEEYLYGVVPHEMPATFRAEALKAQAVAARGYAYQTNGELWCSTMSQVYVGHSKNTRSVLRINQYDATAKKITVSSGNMHEWNTGNSAVDATKNRVVTYKGKVADTQFCSSSGGHTANVTDVWGDTDKPYLAGVVDADTYVDPATKKAVGSFLNWGPIAFSSAVLGSKLSKYTGGKAVTSVSVEHGQFGYVRHVTVRWSGGSKTLTGDGFRAALGLKSTRFTVKVTGLWARYDNLDSRITYSQGWKDVRSSNFYKSSERSRSKAKGTATFKFKGTGARWLATVGPAYGRASVYVDGKYAGTVSLYAATQANERSVWAKTGLANGTHTVSIRPLGKKVAGSHGTTVDIDAVEIYGGGLTR